MSRPLRRAITVLACSGLLTAGVVALATPADASSNVFLAASSTALVDSATPLTSHVNPTTMPIGTRIDAQGERHTTKAYFTFDVSQLVGHEVLSAQLAIPETAVADCSVTTVPQAWLTDTDTAPTFPMQPRERTELTEPSRLAGCPDSLPLTWDAIKAIRQAVAHGSRTATIEVRLAHQDQHDPAHGITIDPAAHLLLAYNILPEQPTGLTVGGKACADTPVFVPSNFPGVTLSATVTDPDDPGVGVEFDWWPVADPTQRTTINVVGISGLVTRTAILSSALADGTTYAWQVRGIDHNQSGQETLVDGPFSAVCQFTTDFTPPATAPTITSTDYPEGVFAGGVGVPGTFTFSGNGDPDVTGFVEEPAFSNVIPADHPGGTASVQITPTSPGPKSITVHTVDEVGNLGPSTTYQYFVAVNAPTVTCSPDTVFLGQPFQCTFTDTDAITGYTYQLDNDPATTVPADAQGTATVTITPRNPFANGLLRVTARLANGNDSAEADAFVQIDTGAPTIDQSATQVAAGTPVDFTFHAVLPGTVSFTYTVDNGDPVTVPAAADGTATVTLVPADPGFTILTVFGTTADGVQSASMDAFLQVS